MDEPSVPLEAESAEQWVQQVEITCSVLVEVARLFGLTLNFQQGKTEAVLLILGSDVATVCSCLAADGSADVDLLSGGGAVMVVAA